MGQLLVRSRAEHGQRVVSVRSRYCPTRSPEQLAAINAEVDALLDANDAVADLALAEGVHQAAQGNFDRAAANLDAYGKGGLPPEPDVIRTPLSGTILTHRVAVHLATDASTTVSPVLVSA